MNLKNQLIVAFLLFGSCLLIAQSPTINPFFSIQTDQNRSDLSNATKAQLKSNFVKNINRDKPQDITLILPDEDGNPLVVLFHVFDIFSDDFILLDDKGNKYKNSNAIFYKGEVNGNQGFATLSIFNDRISALISLKDKGNIHIARDNDAKNNFEYWIYNDKDWKTTIPFECYTDEITSSIPVSNPPTDRQVVDQCVEVYLEADYFMFQDYGTVQGVMDYLSEVWVHVAALYDAEEITMNISEIFVWTSNDPYSDVNAGSALQTFQAFRPNFNGDIAHLVSTNPGNIGGIAFLGALCTDVAYGFSNITNSFNPLPNYSWTINVLTHEIGHTLGSYHTHSCNWPQGPLDNCSPPEGSCNPGPSPSNGGTIMSYCHLTGIGIDFNNGFGDVPGDLIRSNVAVANCLDICDNDGGTGVGPEADFTWSFADPCVTAIVLFDNASFGSGLNYFWEFEGGNPASSTDENPLVQYDFPGNYNVSLTASNIDGSDTEIKIDAIEVQQLPIVDIAAINLTGNTFQFTSDSNNANSWYWEFGDGNISFEQNPQHTYSSSGTFNVIHTASNICGSVQENISVSVNLSPIAAFSQTNTVGCAPLTVNFLNQSLHNPTDFNWQFEGGSPSSSNEMSPQVSYQIPGTYDVILEVQNDVGSDLEVKQNLVTVNPGPVASFIHSINGATAIFTNTSSSFNSVEWDFGDGSSSMLVNPTHTYSENGIYTVSLTVNNDCGTDIFLQNIVISAFAEPGFIIQNFENCTPFQANFVNASINANTVFWQFPGGIPSSSSSNFPSVSYEEPGVYDVVMTVSNGLGSVSETFEGIMLINDTPSADFEYSHLGLNYSFENESLYANEYFWDFGDGNYSFEENPQHTFEEEGTYLVRLEANGMCGNDSKSKFVTIFNFPNGSIDLAQTSYCVDELINITANTSSNVTEYFWEITGPENFSSTVAEPTFSLSTPGLYSIYLEVSNPAGSDSDFLQNYITIEAEPEVSFQENINILQVGFQSQIINANSVLWSFGDGSTSTSWNPTHSYLSNGDYLVSLTAYNECGSITYSKTITLDQFTFAGFTSDKQSFCRGEFVQFENNSTVNTSEYFWSFPGGIPSTSAEENPLIYYDTPGLYDVSLNVANAVTSDEITIEKYIQVDANETFSIENIPLLAYDPKIIRFNYSNDIPGEYFWSFGDGDQSYVASPVHTYASEGSYDVYMHYENNCIEMDTSFVLHVFTKPQADFVVNNAIGCAPFTVIIDNLSSQNYTEIEWSSPGSIEGTSNLTNPIFTYLEGGVYDVHLKLSNPLYETEIIHESIVNILDVPLAAFDYTSDLFKIEFENNSLFESTRIWDFGDGNESIEESPIHEFEGENSYAVSLISRSPCGVDTVEKLLHLYTKPIADFVAHQTKICSPQNIGFDNLSSDNVTSFEWYFEGAVNPVSNIKDPNPRYESAGTFDVSLIVRNPNFSDTLLLEDYIEAKEVPDINFDYVQSGMNFTFINQTQDADSYLWSFGDGGSSQEENPSYHYTSTSNYFVQLTAVNECGQGQLDIPIESREVPKANFSVSKLKACVGSEFVFTNLSEPDAELFEWILPGADTTYSVEKNPSVIYAYPGKYDVSLIAHSAYGSDTTKFENYIEVQELPVADFLIELMDNKVQLVNLSQSSDENLWLSELQVSMESNPVFEYSNNGLKEVQLIVENTCGRDTITKSFEITALPQVEIKVPAKICIGETFQLTSKSENVDHHSWYINGELIGSSSSDSLSWQLFEAGIYDVRLIGVNGFGQTEVEILSAFEVIAQPIASFGFEFFNEQILLSDLSMHGEFYEWNFGDGTSSQLGGDQFHLYAEAGIYEVRLVVSNFCGADTISRLVDANVLLPELNFFTNNDLCVPTYLDVNNQTDGDVIGWYWRLSGPDTLEAFEAVPDFLISKPGTYNLYVEVANEFGNVSVFHEEYFTVMDAPRGEFQVEAEGAVINFENLDENSENYFWNFGDGNSSEAKKGQYTYTRSGDYIIQHQASNVCGEITTEQELLIEIPNQYGKDHIELIEVYPSPASSEITIELEAYIDHKFEVQVVNGIGQLVKTVELFPIGGTRKIKLYIDELTQGIYHIWIKAAEYQWNTSFIKY